MTMAMAIAIAIAMARRKRHDNDSGNDLVDDINDSPSSTGMTTNNNEE